MKSGWSRRLNKLIWDEKRLPCAWTFKRARVRVKRGDIHIPGRCKDCPADLTASYDLTEYVIKVRRASLALMHHVSINPSDI